MKPPKAGKSEALHLCLLSPLLLLQTRPMLPLTYYLSSPGYNNGNRMAAQPGEYSRQVGRGVRCELPYCPE